MIFPERGAAVKAAASEKQDTVPLVFCDALRKGYYGVGTLLLSHPARAPVGDGVNIWTITEAGVSRD